jgi:hypothetical protein
MTSCASRSLSWTTNERWIFFGRTVDGRFPFFIEMVLRVRRSYRGMDGSKVLNHSEQETVRRIGLTAYMPRRDTRNRGRQLADELMSVAVVVVLGIGWN